MSVPSLFVQPPHIAKSTSLLTTTALDILALFSYTNISLPILTPPQLLEHHTSLIAQGQLYSAGPSSGRGRSTFLRPEFTPLILEAALGTGTTTIWGGKRPPMPLRLSYAGPAFRHERQQLGRYREFTQVGAELIHPLGASTVAPDAELVSSARAVLDAVDLTSHTTLLVNHLGNLDDRTRFCSALVTWLSPRRRQLSPLAQAQLDAGGQGLLRILDSSDDDDVSILSDPTCPVLADFVSSHDRQQFEETLDTLQALGIEAEVRPTLVRGLDYYTGLAFEFVSKRNPALTLLGGGRYDPLVQQYDARCGGIGFAAGVERMALTLAEGSDAAAAAAAEAGSTLGHARTVALVYEPSVSLVTALATANALRADGFTVYMRHSGNLKKQIGSAVDHGARLLLRLDSPTTCVLKDLHDPQDRTGVPYPLDKVRDALMRRLFAGIEWMDST